jgi:hypothetical protein
LIGAGANAQYCYPTFTTGSASQDYIETFQFETIANASGASLSPFTDYYAFAGQYTPPLLFPGSTYFGFLTAGSYVPGTGAFETYHIWIDFNIDGDFIDIGEDIGEYQTTLAGEQVDFSVYVPLTATGGLTRMRVVNTYALTGITSCGAFNYGESEDYDVEIYSSIGSYCNTTYTSGTGGGDFINSLNLNNINVASGANPTPPYYSNYVGFGGIWQTNLTTGTFYTATIGAGTFVPQYYTMWIDYNNDGDFYDLNEELGEVLANTASQTVSINFIVPTGITLGDKRLRIRCSDVSGGNLDPCTTYSYGETEDYTVTIQNPVASNYCVPVPTNGTSGNDFINSVILGGINNQFSGSLNGPSYNDYTFLSTNLTQSSNYNLTVQSGDYVTDYYAVWIDYNHDNDFIDAGEKLGEFQTSTALQNLNFNFSVPPNATLGATTMRVRCVYNQANMDPCTNYTYGETEDYTVNIISGSGPAPYCETNLHQVNCDIVDAIDEVYLVNSSLFNLGTGCNSLNGTGYTNWPASGSTTTTVLRNQVYSLGVTSTATSIISVWFDWDDNGVFATNEWYQVTTSSTPNTATVINVQVPNNAVLGQIRMRVRSRAAGNPNSSIDPCTLFGSGETEDYTITVSNSSCLPPTAIISGQFTTGTTADFFDFSSNFPTSWSWTFQGATPGTSNLQDPTGITFPTTGGC